MHDFYVIAHEHLHIFRKPSEGEDRGAAPGTPEQSVIWRRELHIRNVRRGRRRNRRQRDALRPAPSVEALHHVPVRHDAEERQEHDREHESREDQSLVPAHGLPEEARAHEADHGEQGPADGREPATRRLRGHADREGHVEDRADGQGESLGPAGGRRGQVTGTFFHAIAKSA